MYQKFKDKFNLEMTLQQNEVYKDTLDALLRVCMAAGSGVYGAKKDNEFISNFKFVFVNIS